MKKVIVVIIAVAMMLVGIVIVSLRCLGEYNSLVKVIFFGGTHQFTGINNSNNYCVSVVPFFKNLSQYTQDATYIVLFQNNSEIRPSGGFMGSFARVQFENNVLKNWEIENIHVADGQITTELIPPIPLQQAFRLGFDTLRNSNWEIDFTQAGAIINKFFLLSGEEKIDGIIAVNTGLIKKWLQVVGTIRTPDYPELVTADTFYDLAQRYAEQSFFPGSTQKQDYLRAVGKALWDKTQQSSIFTKIKLARLIYDQLEKKQILIWLADTNRALEISHKEWDGGLGNYEVDYLYPVESNLGANKANCCIDRHLVQEVTLDKDIQSSVAIELINENPSNTPHPPESWGGDYINYERIVIPAAAQITKVAVNDQQYVLDNNKDPIFPPNIDKDFGYSTQTQGKFTSIGFWTLVPAQKSIKIQLVYKLPLQKNEAVNYEVVVRRQPGIYKLPYRLYINGKKKVDQILEADKTFTFSN
ncbi:TPA: hypothetical protein DIV55_06055 [Patescibacteria group bacterium]|uniref:Uncharacterized protein n=1 Tax=Candidatus Gottesmanbacteria bacterium GW2011_GWA1_43_11 TaxID=1618436 RepID=A0A0G1EKE7_9BACT|nr:MAG: hypothetical protein UV59_C0037G0005 [Candidatus Gottesmanbacteria bacterium GW2011_GWA1_43_11]HCS79269.1 hypothetical protein [Patescibacteria group bacterium]